MCSSRLKTNPATIFDVFVELASPPGQKAFIIWKYPEDFTEEKILKHIVEFAFPCEINNEAVQLFSFVLTNFEGKYTFGYCRHAPKSNTCLCFLSALPWSELFYKFLNHIAALSNSTNLSNSSNREQEIENLLVAAYHQEIPGAGDQFVIEPSSGNHRLECVCPDDLKLPRIPDNRHLTEYYNAVDESNMIAVWASMLCERRVVMVSSKLGRLTSCILAANLLIYPMHWQHIFIPILPEPLFNYLHAPMPFLIGVPTVNFAKAVKEIDMSEIVILNVDTREFRSPYNDVASLPAEVLSVLKKNLKNSNHLLGDGVARSFLRALVVLIGGYREALQFRPGESILFSPDMFILSRPPPLRNFLTKMLELQIFRQFIEDKLDILNSGFGFKDEFESECSLYSGKEYGKFKNQYNEWFSNVRKESGAIMKQIKTKVRIKGKEAFKDIKYKLSELKDEAGGSGRPKTMYDSASALSSPASQHKRSHTNRSTSSLTKLNTMKNKPLLNLSGDNDQYLSSDSIDKMSNKSDSSIDRRQKTRHLSIMKNRHSNKNDFSNSPLIDNQITIKNSGNGEINFDQSEMKTKNQPSTNRSLLDEFEDVLSKPTRILSILENEQQQEKSKNAQKAKSHDSLLNFSNSSNDLLIDFEIGQNSTLTDQSEVIFDPLLEKSSTNQNSTMFNNSASSNFTPTNQILTMKKLSLNETLMKNSTQILPNSFSLQSNLANCQTSQLPNLANNQKSQLSDLANCQNSSFKTFISNKEQKITTKKPSWETFE